MKSHVDPTSKHFATIVIVQAVEPMPVFMDMTQGIIERHVFPNVVAGQITSREREVADFIGMCSTLRKKVLAVERLFVHPDWNEFIPGEDTKVAHGEPIP